MSKCNCDSCATSRWWDKLKESGSREEIIEFTQERLEFFLEGQDDQSGRIYSLENNLVAALTKITAAMESKKLLEEYERHLRTIHEGAVEEVRNDFTSGVETGLRAALEHLEALRATGAKEQV